MWAAQKPALLQTGWCCLRLSKAKPAKISPSGEITVEIPSEWVVCKRGIAIGHSQNVVVETRESGDPDGFILETPRL